MKLPKADLNRWGEWVEFGRSLAALLFVPCLCIYAVLMVLLIWKGGWSDDTQAQRLDYFGYSLLGILVLIGLGLVWAQRRDIPNINISGPGFQAKIGDGADGDADIRVGADTDRPRGRHRSEGDVDA